MSQCNCKICKRSRKFDSIMLKEKLEEKDKIWLKELYNDLINIEESDAYYKSIMNGTWPTAERILKNKLKMIEERKYKNGTL